ncbi:hypothetical protein BD626DRAFT_495435 [Schizophyllum amplum]|uniref:Uncharacterized protein n=1 Tax=Schizophyllum amplum TaxID=97359 RepID=A0A550CE63_9AGAR|nr:hypothetical protein BD626DRAFT_495435 [Auriculariopsis ampla]
MRMRITHPLHCRSPHPMDPTLLSYPSTRPVHLRSPFLGVHAPPITNPEPVPIHTVFLSQLLPFTASSVHYRFSCSEKRVALCISGTPDLGTDTQGPGPFTQGPGLGLRSLKRVGSGLHLHSGTAAKCSKSAHRPVIGGQKPIEQDIAIPAAYA